MVLERVRYRYSELSDYSDGVWLLITWDSVGEYTPYKDLYQHEQPEFGTFRMTDIPGKGFPHTKAYMYNNLDTNDEEILRGELLTILRLMLGQLRKARLLQHMKAPVIFYLSFPLPTVAYRVLCRSFWSRLWVNVPALLRPITTANLSSCVLPSSTISPRKHLSGSRTLQNGISARRQGIRSRSVFGYSFVLLVRLAKALDYLQAYQIELQLHYFSAMVSPCHMYIFYLLVEALSSAVD